MKNAASLPGVFLLLALFFANCKEDSADPSPVIFSAASDIQAEINAFKAQLGVDNGGEPGTKGSSGFREINWDALSDAESAPNLYEPGLFNASLAPRSRGVVISTPGTGLMVSAGSDNPANTPLFFGNINPDYTQIFPAFSGERLFAPIGSNIADIRFYVPGSDTKAVVRGLGAVFVDADGAGNTTFQCFDIDDKSLGLYPAPVFNQGPVFLGVLFSEARVHRVRVVFGNAALGPDDGAATDVSVMDNFIFSEPQAAQ